MIVIIVAYFRVLFVSRNTKLHLPSCGNIWIKSVCFCSQRLCYHYRYSIHSETPVAWSVYFKLIRTCNVHPLPFHFSLFDKNFFCFGIYDLAVARLKWLMPPLPVAPFLPCRRWLRALHQQHQAIIFLSLQRCLGLAWTRQL